MAAGALNKLLPLSHHAHFEQVLTPNSINVPSHPITSLVQLIILLRLILACGV